MGSCILYKKCFKHNFLVYTKKNKTNIIMIPINQHLVFSVMLPKDLFFLSPKKSILYLFSERYFSYLGLLYYLIDNFYFYIFNNYRARVYLFGLGFKFLKFSDSFISFKLGLSHKVYFPIYRVCISKSKTRKNHVAFHSINLRRLVQTLSILRTLREPDVYRARGFRM